MSHGHIYMSLQFWSVRISLQIENFDFDPLSNYSKFRFWSSSNNWRWIKIEIPRINDHVIAKLDQGQISNSWNFVDQNRNSKSLTKIETRWSKWGEMISCHFLIIFCHFSKRFGKNLNIFWHFVSFSDDMVVLKFNVKW